jgi:hypothetical protein
MRVERQTVDLSGYPELVVLYLGMRETGTTTAGRPPLTTRTSS